jgi:hypothetical protein
VIVATSARRAALCGVLIKSAITVKRSGKRGMPSQRWTDTLDDAKREFAAAWRAWLAKTGRDEETYRPRYGSPATAVYDRRHNSIQGGTGVGSKAVAALPSGEASHSLSS